MRLAAASIDADAPPLRLRFATSIVDAWAVTQSIPAMICEVVPVPLLPRTRTDHRRAPGATPTTPIPLSMAPIVPATCVPWPLPSSPPALHVANNVAQFVLPTTFRSG